MAWRLPSHQQPGPSVGGRGVLFTDPHLHTGTKVHSNQRKGTLRHPHVPFPGRTVRKHAAWEVFPTWTLVLVRGLCFSCESVPRVKAPWLPGLCRGSECACSVCNLGVLIPQRVCPSDTRVWSAPHFCCPSACLDPIERVQGQLSANRAPAPRTRCVSVCNS